jgi:hypothetical protein
MKVLRPSYDINEFATGELCRREQAADREGNHSRAPSGLQSRLTPMLFCSSMNTHYGIRIDNGTVGNSGGGGKGKVRPKRSLINQGHRAVERTRAVHIVLVSAMGNCCKSGIRASAKVERARSEKNFTQPWRRE